MNSALDRTSQLQQRVGSPYRSAWVSANAGTGKTYVLVRRVIRQLLAGAPPAAILCITYTKAAAAEMSSRLLGMLSEWSLMPDDQLAEEVMAVSGTRPDAHELREARRLFARAVESPGGLKIQTIHSFCASLLARFPAEAGLQLGFRSLEDDEAAMLLREAVRSIGIRLGNDDRTRASIGQLSERFQEQDDQQASFVPAIESIIQQYSDQLRGQSVTDLDIDQINLALRAATGGKEGDTEENLLTELVDSVDQAFLRELVSVREALGKRLQNLADRTAEFLERPSIDNALLAPFCFKGTCEPYDVEWLGKSRDKVSDFDQRYTDLSDLVQAYRNRWLALTISIKNEALLWVAALSLHSYRAEKERIGALDYNDLIERSLYLLREVDNAWIRFKLDQGIDHILLDEAQDNSDLQWQVFNELSDEIVTSHQSAAGETRLRSVFVVGDPKQSIYAFQGAEAESFRANQARYETTLQDALASESLFLSFRTAQPVLDVVDSVFRQDEFTSVSGLFPQHESRHTERYGSVEVWPSLPPPEKVKQNIWTASVDAPTEDSYDRRAALALVRDIERRLATQVPLACRGSRAVRADDVMILFQRRGNRFSEVLRALADASIPCAGTDRVQVADDQAVHDLISLLRFAANTDDSLSLAVLLKSPFFGWSEDMLFDLCAERERSVLWLELNARAEGHDRLATEALEAARELQSALDKAAREGPYALITHMLEGGGHATGRRRLARRLGPGYRDAVDAFIDEVLSYEDVDVRSVHGFLHRAERLRKAVKRESHGQAAAGVRLLTVHGAKGLEAPIVYLADADFLKNPGSQAKNQPVVSAVVTGLDRPMPFLLPRSSRLDTPWVRAVREDAQNRTYQEYQRLLYVAATRAEESLVVCGGKEDKSARTWHSLMRRGIEAFKDDPQYAEEEEGGGPILRYATPDTPHLVSPESASAVETHSAPDWLHQQAEEEVANPVIYPSSLGDDAEDPVEVERFAAEGGDARLRGILIHRLLEQLPGVAADQRPEFAMRILAPYAEEISEGACDGMIASAITLLQDDAYAALFGSDSRGEVSVQGTLDGIMVSGEIDRLVVTNERVTVAEFKTTQWVPKAQGDVPRRHAEQIRAYRRLIAVMYPGRDVQALLVYTAAPRAFVID
ncbi:MAG: double-strand break repair helicase AddA [Pseudomonadota bacterium]